MGLLDFLKAPTSEQKAATAGSSQPLPDIYATLEGYRLPSSHTTANPIEVFTSTAFACITQRMGTLGRARMSVVRRIDPEKTKPLPPNHWAVLLFADPVPFRHIVPSMVNEWIEMWHCLRGRSYLVCALGRDPLTRMEVPVTMAPVPPTHVTPIVSGTGHIRMYEQVSARGNIIPVPPELVVDFLNPGPFGGITEMYTEGFGLIEAAINDIGAEDSIKEYIRESLTRFMPPWFLKGFPEGPQRQLFRDEARKKGKSGGLEPIGFLPESASIEAVDTMKPTRDAVLLAPQYVKAICAALKVPVALLDPSQLNGREQASVNLAQFLEDVMQPRWERMCQVWTRFLQQWEADIEVIPSPLSKGDTEELRADAAFRMDNGLASRNDILSEQGLKLIPDKEGGNARFVKAGYVLLSEAATGTAGKTPAPQAPPEKIHRAVVDSFVVSAVSRDTDEPDDWADAIVYHAAYDKPAQETSDELQRIITREIEAFGARFAEAYQPEKARAITRDGDELTGNIELDFEALTASLAATGTEPVAALIDATFARAVVEGGLNWADVVTDFDEHVRRALDGSLVKIKEAVPTMKAELSAMLKANSGKPAAELQQLIRQFFPQYTQARAGLIARTTATYATCASQMEAWRELEIPYQWLTGVRPRDTHAAANNQYPDAEGLFRIGEDSMRHPCAGTVAKENCNCNCYLRARPKGKPTP